MFDRGETRVDREHQANQGHRAGPPKHHVRSGPGRVDSTPRKERESKFQDSDANQGPSDPSEVMNRLVDDGKRKTAGPGNCPNEQYHRCYLDSAIRQGQATISGSAYPKTSDEHSPAKDRRGHECEADHGTKLPRTVHHQGGIPGFVETPPVCPKREVAAKKAEH